MAKKNKSNNWLRRVGSLVRNLLAALGLGTIVALVSNIDVVQRWLVDPKLTVEVIQLSERRGSAFSVDGAVTDVRVKLNVVPRVRYHIGPFPVNQIKGVAFEKKGKRYEGSRYWVEPDLPITVKDEPIVLTVALPGFPIEWAETWNDVEVLVTDRWGRISSVVLRNSS